MSLHMRYDGRNDSIIERGLSCKFYILSNGKQHTIIYHPHGTKVSHMGCEIVTSVFEMIEQHFRKMKIASGNAHEFLGIKIAFCDDEKCSISMRPNLETTASGFVEESLEAPAPERSDLFHVNGNGPYADKKRRKLLYCLVSRLAHCTGRGRKHLETTMPFLIKRPNSCNEHDY